MTHPITVPVTVTTPVGTSAAGPAQYTYVPPPVVTAVNPASGLSTAGGTSVAITGSGFNGVTAVHFGPTPATAFTVHSATSITATSPAATSIGTVDVTVAAQGGTSAINTADEFTYPLLVATWNVYHGNLPAGNDPFYNQPRLQSLSARIAALVNYGDQNDVHIIAFQEIPNSLAWPPAGVNMGNYNIVRIQGEYPPSPPPPASQTTDGYVILYNQNILTPVPPVAINFFHRNAFMQGISQARPPAGLQFTANNGQIDFSFLTWHAEPQQALAATDVTNALGLLQGQAGNWILAGDLNVRDNVISASGIPNDHHVAHDNPNVPPPAPQSALDHIVSDVQVDGGFDDKPTPAEWGTFWSDAHYALFGSVLL
jgi:hypothetical protein